LALIRPAVLDAAFRWREMIAAIVVGLMGLWMMWLGGYLLVPVGGIVLAFGASWAVTALRRMRFVQDVFAPGMVEVDEGQIGYLGPTMGGYVALPDLVELRLMTMQGRRLWRLKQADGQTLLIPVDAAGADRLFDAFASLPGMDTAALVAALGAPPVTGQGGLPALRHDDNPAQTPAMKVIWRRQAALARA
jgi:hypothetical protein